MAPNVLRAALLIGASMAIFVIADAGPVRAQDTDDPPTATQSAAPVPTEVPTRSDPGRPDLYLDMPFNLGGFEPDVVMVRGEEHFADLAPDDPTRRELEELLAATGAEAADLVSGYALVSQEDFFSFVVAIRVEGAEPGTLLPAYLPTLLDDLLDPRVSSEVVAGREVTIVTAIGDDDSDVELAIYDQGDTIWMVQGPADVVAATVADLP